MTLLRKLVLALFVSITMIATAPIVSAAGKVQNQTEAEVKIALDDMVAAVEETQAALTSGADKDSVMALYKKTKQIAKMVQSNVVLSVRDRGLARLKKSRIAFKKGKQEEAEEWMTKAVKILTETRTKYHNF